MLKILSNSVALVRVWALISRFLLIGISAIELTANQFGQWSLVITAVTLLSYLIGLDLYVPTVRALYEAKARYEAVSIFRAIAFVYAINFSLICCVLIGFEQLKIYAVASTPLVLVFSLLFFEHLSAEANRQLNLLGYMKQANNVLFLRSSLPVIFFGLFCFVGKNDLNSLLIAQITGTAIAIWPAWNYLRQYLDEHFPSVNFINIPPMSILPLTTELLKGSGLVFLTTCLLKAGQALDRQALAALADLPRVGAYALTMASSSAIVSVIDAVLISISISKLLDASKNKDIAKQISIHQQLRRNLLLLSSTIHVAILVVFVTLIVSSNQSKYDFNVIEVSLLLCASLISTYSLADAAFLFSIKKDKVSFWAALVGLVTLCVTIFLLKDLIGENAVACGVFAAAVVVWLVRRLSINSICKNQSKLLSFK